MLDWFRNLFRRRLPEFKPGVFYDEELRLTEIILKDTSIVWYTWGQGHAIGRAIDCGYDFQDKLVGIRIWDDVRKRGDSPTRANVGGAALLDELYGKGAMRNV